MKRWPHQIAGVRDCLLASAEGHGRILLASPTGAGKSLMLADLIRRYLERQCRVVVYTNRKMLVDQLSKDLAKEGLVHGIRASGKKARLREPLQISSLQTEGKRSLGPDAIWELHDAALVLVDEAHLQCGPTARKIIDRHEAEGATIIGATATPLDMDGMYDHLVVAGCTSELRACGALVPAYHYGPDEPDLRAWKKQCQLGVDLSERQQVNAMMAPNVFGRVFDSWRRLNQDQQPTLLFGPGKGPALWLAERFHAAGVSTAHIDGDIVWLNGQTYRTSTEAREEVAAMHREGKVKVVTNRYVMREAINWPWVRHLIMAFVAGSLKTYLQVGGRGLRAAEGKDKLIVQDHGGGWWRHGSLNADRHWQLGQTSRGEALLRADALRNPEPGEPPQPARCPACAAILLGWRCRVCGHEIPPGTTRSRPVVESNGQLSEMRGDPFKRRQKMEPTEQALRDWESMYWRARSEKWDATFFQAEAMFASEHEWQYPDRSMPFMPIDRDDWGRRVRDVSPEKLTQKQELVPQ